MNKARLTGINILILLLMSTVLLQAQSGDAEEKLGLPGDNLNLAAVLDVFQHSKTLEEFETALNTDTNRINNLDLNNDDQIDYIRVIDQQDGETHTIILRADLSEAESQDVAVILVEKKGEEVDIQLIGDEDLYGENYILEPSLEQRSTPNPGYSGDGKVTNITNNYYYNRDNSNYYSSPGYCPAPSSWLIISFIYGPSYVFWDSPWHWGYYPGWWRPWRPSYWDVYYHHWYYHHHWNGWWYWRSPHPRFERYYAGYRTNRRHSGVVINYKSNGTYNKTYRNPNPDPRPSTKPNFPSHSIHPDKNPVMVGPKSKVVQPAVKDSRTPSSTPIAPPKTKAVKPAAPSKDKLSRPSKPVTAPAPPAMNAPRPKAPDSRKPEAPKSPTSPKPKTR